MKFIDLIKELIEHSIEVNNLDETTSEWWHDKVNAEQRRLEQELEDELKRMIVQILKEEA